MTWSCVPKCLLLAAALCLFSVPSGGNEDALPDVKVELSTQKPLWLHITIRSRAETRVTFYKWRLPWGNLNSVKLVAMTPGEKYLERGYPIDDPSPEKVSFEPKEQQSGDINLHMKIIGLDAALKKSDIFLFWAYEAPKEMNISRWSGGWILVPQQKGELSPSVRRPVSVKSVFLFPPCEGLCV
jgi:hypothetical protein